MTRMMILNEALLPEISLTQVAYAMLIVPFLVASAWLSTHIQSPNCEKQTSLVYKPRIYSHQTSLVCLQACVRGRSNIN